MRCEENLFPSGQLILIKPVKHVLHVPMLSGKIVLVKSLSVFVAGTKSTPILLALLIFWSDLSADNMVPLSKPVEYY
jgi:hypothetical protein